MKTCNTCKKKLILPRKYCYFSYPGTKKSSLRITEERIECGKCFYSHFSEDYDDDKNTELALTFHKKDFKTALKIHNKIFQKNRPGDWYSRGNILQGLNRTAEALKCYDEALLLDTHYVKAWYRKGWLLLKKNKFEDAMKCFENVIELEDDDYEYPPDNWHLAGIISLLVSTVQHNNALAKKKKSITKSTKKISNLISMLYQPFTLGLIIGEDDDGEKLVFTPQGFDELPPIQQLTLKDIHRFIDLCNTNLQRILDVIEPNILAEFPDPGKEH